MSTLEDIFMCDLGFNLWIAEICQAIAPHCFETVAPGGKLAHRPIPQYDEPSDTPAPHPSFQAGVIDGSPFKQVTLVGSNLYEAWNRLWFTRNLEKPCPQSSTWTPFQPRGMYFTTELQHILGIPVLSWPSPFARSMFCSSFHSNGGLDCS